MRQFTIYNLQFTIFLILFSLYFILYTPVLAGHDVGTEGKYCDGSEIWLDIADGSHLYSDTDCSLSGQICNADAVCEDAPPPPPASPDPSRDEADPSLGGPTPTPTPQINKSPTPDEIALERKNQGLLPQEISSQIEPKDTSLFNKIVDLFKQFLSIFGFTPTSEETFSANAEIQKQTEIPPEIQTSPGSNILEQTSQNLGEDAGIYSISVPKEINQESKDTRGFEDTYEKANFPEGITPITGN